jgi:hypothetical protein
VPTRSWKYWLLIQEQDEESPYRPQKKGSVLKPDEPFDDEEESDPALKLPGELTLASKWKLAAEFYEGAE